MSPVGEQICSLLSVVQDLIDAIGQIPTKVPELVKIASFRAFEQLEAHFIVNVLVQQRRERDTWDTCAEPPVRIPHGTSKLVLHDVRSS